VAAGPGIVPEGAAAMDISIPTTSPSRRHLNALAQTRAYDLVLRLPLAVFYLYVLMVSVPALVETTLSLPALGFPMLPVAQVVARLAFLLFITLMVSVTVLRRRPVAKSPGIAGRLVALGGACLPLVQPLLPHSEPSAAMLLVSAALVMLGNGLALWTLSWLGRSFSVMPEARRPVTGGPYAYIRHPLYACEQIALVGVAVQFFSVYALVLLVAQVALQLGRMHYEERVLAAAFPDYVAYQARTARLIPGLY
jgi:protein-S-isoprenylcysteine O-methyltransferase Ste14